MTYNTDEAFEIAQRYGVTKSKQILYRWLRTGVLPSTKDRKEHRIEHEELMAFIYTKLDPLVKELMEENERLRKKLAEKENGKG